MQNTKGPHNVIYYNDATNPLSDIANTAYTDVIVGVSCASNKSGWKLGYEFRRWGRWRAGQGIVLQSPPDPNYSYE